MSFQLKHRELPRVPAKNTDDMVLQRWPFPSFFSLPNPRRIILSLHCLWILFSNHTSSPRRAISGVLSSLKSWCTHYLIFLRGWALRGWVTKLHTRKEHGVKENKATVHRCTPSNNSYSNTTAIFAFLAKKNRLCRSLYLKDISYFLQSLFRDLN